MDSHKAQHDMTSGGIMKKLTVVSLPIMGTQLLSMMYNFVDMFWLGRIEHAVPGGAIAASGAAGMYMWMSVALMLIGRMGAEIGVSQNTGRGDTQAVGKYAQNSFMLSIFLGIVFAAVMILFRSPLIGFFGIEDARVASDGELYLAIVALGIPASYVGAQLTGTYNAAGNSRTPFLISIIGILMNLVLDPLLIFTFGWGIAGAAIATVAAQYTAVIIALFVTRSKRSPIKGVKLIAKPDFSIIKQIIRWSAPACAESAAFTFLTMILQRFVGSFGTAAFTVSRIGSQIESFSWLVSGGFGTAVVAFIGQNYGAGKWARIHSGFRLSILAMAVWGVIVAVGLFFFGGAMYLLFTDDAVVLSLAVAYMQIVAPGQITACIESVAAGAFKGIGKTVPPAIVSFTSNAARVVLAWFLMRTSLGLNGIWIAAVSGMLVRGTWVTVWYMLAARSLPKHNDE